MENLDILEKLGKVAGIAGIAVGALVLIFGGIIQKNIFPGMTKEQGFRIIRMMIVAASLMALLGIVAWIYIDFKKSEGDKKASLLSKSLVGYVKNEAGNGIASVKTSVVQISDIEDKSDNDGKYVLHLEGKGTDYYDIVFEHPQYQTVRKKITVDFNAKEHEVVVDQVILRSSYPPDPVNNSNPTNQNYQPSNNGNGNGNGNEYNNNTNNSGVADITLNYDDEGQGCRLEVTITIGGWEYLPQTNPVQLLDVPVGYQSYMVSGYAYCGAGECQVWGEGELNVKAGERLYLVFDAFNTCRATILSETTYNELKALYY